MDWHLRRAHLGRALTLALSLALVGCGDASPRSADPARDAGVGDIDAEDVGDMGDAAVATPFDHCDGEPPDDACFAERRSPESDAVALAVRIADTLVETRDPAELRWDWGEAVMLLGLAQTARVTGDGRYLDFIGAYLDRHVAAGYEIETSDTSAPAALAVAMIAAGRETPAYRAIVDEALRYYREEALRTPEGGISHFGAVELFGVSLWADSLFMFGGVMTGWGEIADDDALLDEYAEQYGVFAELLQEEAGFFKHAAYSPFEQSDGVYWARANGWIAAAGYDHLRVRRDRADPSPAVEAASRRLIDAVLAAQDPETGLWWTVINRPGETYLETSASALFAFAMARGWRYGYLGDEVLPAIEAAMAGVRDRIVEGGDGRPVVTGTSGPTNVGTFDYYAGVAVGDDISYGIGAVLLALTETSGLPSSGAPDVTDPPDDVSGPPVFDGDPLLIDEPERYRDRRAEYLAHCLAGTDPGEGGLYGQVCRVAAGEGALDDEEIDGALTHLEERRDVADFKANALVRLLYHDDETAWLGDDRRARIRQTLVGFKYWLDEPGVDGMAYWTENHQILFHTAELLIGQREPDTVFSSSGMTGAEHVAHALPRIERWLDLRGRFGFSEWHSNVYFNEDIPALVNLVDFADDETIRAKATLVLDLIALDLLANTYRGRFATTHGRTYQSKLIGGLRDSTQDAAWIMVGLDEYGSADNFSGTFLATSSYFTPGILEDLTVVVAGEYEHRQRDSFDIEEGPDNGVSYEGIDDVVVWAGLSAIVAPDIIDGAMDVIEAHDLWGGFLFGSLSPELLGLLQSLMGTPGLRNLSVELEPLSRGMALEAVDTYVYRTPDYQVAAAQDYKAGQWAAQTLIWQATLDRDAFVIANAPAALGGLGDVDDVTIDDPWIGGWLPRATAHRNVSVLQFRPQPHAPMVDTIISGTYLHAYFPLSGFDEVRQEGAWRFGSKGDGYLALWCDRPLRQSEENDYELIVDGTAAVFVVELGSASEHGDFDAFVTALASVTPSVDEDGEVMFASPTLGEVRVGWSGPMIVAGDPVDLGPYDRWDNEHVTQRRGADWLRVDLDERVLVLDFAAGTRELYAAE